ncbi:hypothetical protein [Rhodococcus opacus]|uniref:hypothetical protein n=1 Tax=Rhodococcus opacus TaxID=37919 RepID=UPI0012F989F0|nr:hypothetical protein [Rhodococcus opacus]
MIASVALGTGSISIGSIGRGGGIRPPPPIDRARIARAVAALSRGSNTADSGAGSGAPYGSASAAARSPETNSSGVVTDPGVGAVTAAPVAAAASGAPAVGASAAATSCRGAGGAPA